MKKASIKSISIFVLFTFILTIIGILISLALVKGNIFDELNSTFYILGLVFSAGGIFSAISGNPVEASMQGLGQSNAQYLAQTNLKAKEKEEKLGHGLNINFARSSWAFVASGILMIIISKVFL
ncbi:hypothetical protein [Clostridium sp.]|uniref:hypothetical protein n=1 Tax=Clostridium sp. TaxID=1506 RepID=UPI00261A3A5A|nr:hypothetical protein [Clostridium sp.]